MQNYVRVYVPFLVHCPILLRFNGGIYQGSQTLEPTQTQF